MDQGFIGGQKDGYDALLKAMQAGEITGRDTTDQSLTQEPLKAESLETTLKLLDARMKDIRLLNSMPSLTAYNTVEEFLQLSSYGNDRGGFYNEGELSDVEDSTYIRRSELIKYLQVTGEVTLQAQMVRSYVNAMRKETENKVMWIRKRANSAMTKGSSRLIPQEWNGIYEQHKSVGSGDGFLYNTLEDYFTSEVVVDLRGKSLTQNDVENGAVVVDDNFGNVSHLFAPTSVISALSQDFYKDQRIVQNVSSGYNGVIGTVAKAISTSLGDVSLEPDKFMKHDHNKGRTTASNATSDKAPSQPDTVAVSATSDGLSKFESSDEGSVFYGVTAMNRYGESAIESHASPVAITEGNAINITITPGTGSNAATAFRVYRTKVTSAGSAAGLQFYPIFEVSVAERSTGYDGGSAGVVRDRGRFLPDTEQAFITEMVDDVLSFKQLAPISKLDLAVLSPSNRFITFLFATPQLYAPKKIVRFVNCAKKLSQ